MTNWLLVAFAVDVLVFYLTVRVVRWVRAEKASRRGRSGTPTG